MIDARDRMLAVSALASGVAARLHFLNLGISVVCLTVLETVEIGLLDSSPLTINTLDDSLVINTKDDSVLIILDEEQQNILENEDALAIRKC